MQLVDDWKNVTKWWSTRAMATAIAMQGAWMMIPNDLKAQVPQWLSTTVVIVVLALGFGGRMIKQDLSDDQGTEQ